MREYLPTELDGAQIVAVARVPLDSSTGQTKHVSSGKDVPTPYYLAIAQYADDAGFYLFHCDDAWKVVADTYHESVAEAQDQARFEFLGLEFAWVQ